MEGWREMEGGKGRERAHKHTPPHPPTPYEMLSVEKLMMVAMKLSRRRTPRMAFQSVAGSPMSRQIDSIAILIILGGLLRVLISTR